MWFGATVNDGGSSNNATAPNRRSLFVTRMSADDIWATVPDLEYAQFHSASNVVGAIRLTHPDETPVLRLITRIDCSKRTRIVHQAAGELVITDSRAIFLAQHRVDEVAPSTDGDPDIVVGEAALADLSAVTLTTEPAATGRFKRLEHIVLGFETADDFLVLRLDPTDEIIDGVLRRVEDPAASAARILDAASRDRASEPPRWVSTSAGLQASFERP